MINAQHVPVLEGLSGQELLNELKNQFRPNSTLGYNIARDTLFRNILAVNNELSCLYTDYTIPLNPDADPSDNAFAQGINTEHIFPQSKGAENEPLRSNMYNLYPVRENVNSDRANDPYGEVADNVTQWWYHLDIKQKNKPTVDIDKYSEKGNGVFEPQENRKGDIARSIMYFYSVYKPEADAADPNYFQSMTSAICAWHIADPVDSDEWNRNQLIATYQNDKSNPFILDCTLPERSYCSGNGIKCNPSNSTKVIRQNISDLIIFPSIFEESELTIHVESPEDIYQLIITDQNGRMIKTIDKLAGQKTTIQLNNLSKGVFNIFAKDQYGYIKGKGRFTRI